MTKIIAEIGWNHMGDMSLAKKMILAAKENGADYVKTQIFDIKFLKDGPWMKDGRKEIYEKAQLSDEKYKELLEYSNKIGINFSLQYSIRMQQLELTKYRMILLKFLVQSQETMI